MHPVSICFALLTAFLVGASANAAGLSVSPIRVDLDARQSIASVRLGNDDGDEKIIQAKVMRWQRENGVDTLVPTDDLLVSPPIFRVSAAGKQVIRLGLDELSHSAEIEGSYRLVLQELPPEKSEEGQIRILLRLTLPVFIAPAIQREEALEWQLVGDRNRTLSLHLNNRSNVHTRIAQLSLRPSGNAGEALSIDAPGDVLAGEQRSWELAMPAQWHADSAALSITTTRGTHEVTLPIVER